MHPRSKRFRTIPVSEQGRMLLMGEASPYPELREKFVRMAIRMQLEEDFAEVKKVKNTSKRLTERKVCTPPVPRIEDKKHEKKVIGVSERLFPLKPVLYRSRKNLEQSPFSWSLDLRATMATSTTSSSKPKPPVSPMFFARFFERPLAKRQCVNLELDRKYPPRPPPAVMERCIVEDGVARLAVEDVGRRQRKKREILEKYGRPLTG
eukprot:TRINITY_DN23230_c0_g1_i1.p1 TRINITY_DN23230_c0_g1~~TRINITY_DN23230_c0_g1_i1.p1  ORF type:complete len:224 (+),score=32.83 TRINITY_DN23230_c0_g1_i1:52-672(+)